MKSTRQPDLIYASFEQQVVDVLNTPDEPLPKNRLRLLKNLCYAADQNIHLATGLKLPSELVSSRLLQVFENQVPTVEKLLPAMSLSNMGCWELPLKDEYDEKGRSRYPQVTIAELGAKNQLAHRFMMIQALGATLGRFDYIDHVCRVHACCNPTHLDFTTPGQNTLRGRIYRKTVTDQTQLF